MQDRAIDFDVVACPLGWLLVAGTSRGVCNVRLGDDPGELERELRAEFPWACFRRGAARIVPWVQALRRLAAGDSPGLEVPLDVRGSRFQRRVWDTIRALPRGEVRSYGEIARAIGQPRAVRAVAGACAANPVALVVPCHRVVLSDGSSGGYRWGEERKRALLRREQGACSAAPTAEGCGAASRAPQRIAPGV
jgi:AraC family transcriptional regulator of adaptative response/methylated-DNA-[protein]-cysteine methyltransferase